MKSAAHAFSVGAFLPMLRSLSALLEKGAQRASAGGFDVAVLVGARLAPDMYTLAQQVQLACFHATDAVARLTEKDGETPGSADETLDGLKARLERTIAELESAPPAAFEGAEERDIVIPMPGGGMAFEMKGYQFLRDWSLPHFYFHVVTAYDILRHNGVELGKRDYLRGVGQYVRPRPAPTSPSA